MKTLLKSQRLCPFRTARLECPRPVSAQSEVLHHGPACLSLSVLADVASPWVSASRNLSQASYAFATRRKHAVLGARHVRRTHSYAACGRYGKPFTIRNGLGRCRVIARVSDLGRCHGCPCTAEAACSESRWRASAHGPCAAQSRHPCDAHTDASDGAADNKPWRSAYTQVSHGASLIPEEARWCVLPLRPRRPRMPGGGLLRTLLPGTYSSRASHPGVWQSRTARSTPPAPIARAGAERLRRVYDRIVAAPSAYAIGFACIPRCSCGVY